MLRDTLTDPAASLLLAVQATRHTSYMVLREVCPYFQELYLIDESSVA